MKVPRALILQVCYPTCHRPVVKVPFKEPEPPRRSWDSMLPRHYHRNNNSAQAPGNIPEDEYKYYAGDRDPSFGRAYCRWCLRWVDTDYLKTHRAQTNCAHMVDIVSALLHKDDLCVVCQKFTKSRRWGVPLCAADAACVPRFKFEYNFPAWMDSRWAAKKLPEGTKVGHVKV